MEIFKLFGSIMVDNDDANKSISKTDKSVDTLGKKFGRGIKTAGKWAIGVAAATVGVGIAAFAMVKKVTGGFDEIAKNSKKLGVTTDAYQEMDYWASQNGISNSDMEKAVGRLNQRLGDTINGGDKYNEVLERLGVSTDDLREGTLSTEEAMYQSISALSQIENEQEKAALASELFGTKLGRELMPALQDGSLSLEDAAKKAQELGIVIEEDTLKAAEEFNDTWDDLTRSARAFGQKALAYLMPMFQAMMDWVLDHMPLIQSIFETAFDVISTVAKKVGGFIRDELLSRLQELWEWVQPHLPMVKELFIDAFERGKELIADLIVVIQEVTGWFKEHWAVIEPIFIGIAAGVIAFELITAAIALWTTVTTFATGVGVAFAAVMAFITSPIGIIVLAIAGLVAVGILLYKNWETIREKAIEIFNSVLEFFSDTFNNLMDIFGTALDWIDEKTNGKFSLITDTIRHYITMARDIVSDVINFIKRTFENGFKLIKGIVTGDMSLVKGAFSDQMENIKKLGSDILNNIKKFFSDTFGDILSSAKTKFNEIKDAMLKPIEDAKSLISGIIDDIKGFFSGLSLKFPKIEMPKMPKFKLDGKFGLVPPSVPKISVNWNAMGGVFNTPTLFNTANAGLQGVGEAGSEAILPLNKKVLGGIGQGIASTMGNQERSNDTSAIEGLLLKILQAIIDGKNIVVNGKVLGEVTDDEQGKRVNLSGRVAY